MREIKFRAWLKENYLERYGWDKRAEELGRMRKVHSIHLNKKKVIISSKYGGNISVPFQYIELMQYTGIKDKNGVEIYEGDVVKINDDYDTYGKNAGEIYEVYFNAGGFRLKPKYDTHKRGDRGFWLDNGNDVAVLGNIYENPNLLP